MKHFLQLTDFDLEELEHLLRRARVLKDRFRHGEPYQPLRNKTLGMLFEKSSTRTRVSFEAGMSQLGGTALFLTTGDTQLGRGEPIEDLARVLTRMVDIVMIRTYSQHTLECFAAHSEVPVINGLSNEYHPCQILADIFTYMEKRGSIRDKTVSWVGDGNNVCHTWAQAATLFDFKLHIACPKGYEVGSAHLNAHTQLHDNPQDAVRNAHVVTTDVWTSMGFEAEAQRRKKDFVGYQVDAALMSLAQENALFMHCLPAHRGEEVSAEVMDGPHSVVWEEAENRLHTAKALLEYMLLGKVRSANLQ
jgi:ornithine carbamoyltransferase